MIPPLTPAGNSFGERDRLPVRRNLGGGGGHIGRCLADRISLPFFLAFALQFAALTALAGDLKLGAQLIWGANDSPVTVNHNLVDPDLSATFRQHFKWTNYYEITNVSASVPLNESRDVRMSDRCTLKIRNLGSSVVAVDCIGQGKAVSKGTNTLPCVYCGTNVNDTAWFIRLRSLDEK